jgi:hypothetical protein
LIFEVSDGADAVALLRSLFGDQLPQEPLFTTEASGLVWTLYQLEVQGSLLLIAASAKDGKVYLVAVQGAPADVEVLARIVLQPILNNFTIN